MSVIIRWTLDDVPAMTCTMHIRANQLQALFQRWTDMPHELQVSRLDGVRIELNIQVESVIEGRRLCCEHDLFRLEGLERALGEAFDTSKVNLDRHLELCQQFLEGLTATLYGRDERRPSVDIISALTFTCQAFGWSGRYSVAFSIIFLITSCVRAHILVLL